jgi:DNA polymerase
MARALLGSSVSVSLASLAKHYALGVKGTEVVNALGKYRADFTKEELARYGEYCCNDADLTYNLFTTMMQDGFPVAELRLIDLTTRMFSEPVLGLDVGVLDVHLAGVQDFKKGLLGGQIYPKEDLMSNPKLAQILWELGVEPPMKISPTTGKETYAFAKSDEAFKDLLEHKNIVVQAIVAARLGVKSTLEETRTERFIQIASRGLLPVPLRYYAAHTGRWGGTDKINMQNIPRNSALKRAFTAPEGFVLIDSDSSQIEARTLAWLAGQQDLVDAFERGEDVYKIMASAIYGKDILDVTKDERFVGKTTILGCGYGMGAAKFKTQLKTMGVDMPQEECERIIYVYRETYPQIPLLWKQAQTAVKAMVGGNTSPLGPGTVLTVVGNNGILLPNGLHLKYPNIRCEDEGGKSEYFYDVKKGNALVKNKIYGGKLVENVCQALARIMVGEQMLLISKKYKVAMTVHDSVIAVVPKHEAETGKEFVEMAMRMRPKWGLDLPLNCEAGVGPNYGECK